MKARSEMPLLYSGPGSVKFWKRVNALPEQHREKLYLCGVLLQDVEHRVLAWLEQAEDRAKDPTQ